MLKTHNCGELRAEDAGKEVTLAGWLNRRRDHGGLIFLDLRDRFGITQVTVNSDERPNAHKNASEARGEFVVQVKGWVHQRPAGFENSELATGMIEVLADEVTILTESLTPPFYLSGSKSDDVDEALRLKYRYLDLRRPRLAQNMILRHNVVRYIREFFYDRDFLEIETPILLKSTPEGARDFVVPSRLHAGKFYALPQSPQQMKQLLMVAGMERYFQIARCFRDEDLRADRQPEFTQLDLEMSFVDVEDIRALIEALMIELSGKVSPKQIQQIPFPAISYDDAMEKYGIDRPDLRFGCQLFNITDAVAESNFGVFQAAATSGGQVKGLVYPGGADLSRRELDGFTDFVKQYGAKGVAWIGVSGAPDAEGHYSADALRSQITKFLSPAEIAAILKCSGAAQGDLILIVADKPGVVAQSLANLRLEIGKRANLIDPNELAFCWVLDFPLLEYNEDEKRWEAVHHPFTSAKDEDWDLLENDPGAVKAKAYDIILNGWEIGGGSIRIHRSDNQARLFKRIGLSEEDIDARFGHIIEAFQYGAPPHGGIALGIERVVALYADAASIRDVMAFPKTAMGTDLMLEAPSLVDERQLAELHIRVREEDLRKSLES
jgi:aspartyl-tRNA synthetase